eukprot:gene25176-46146_t
MPVQLLVRKSGVWFERGVVVEQGALQWGDRPTALRPPVEIEGEHDYLTEIHPQGEAFVRTLADRLVLGAALLLDYGFPESEYYHVQRHMGTVMCHQAHRSDPDPLQAVGLKDITAHVNFTGIALAAQDAGLDVLGYTSQAHLLINCGLVEAMQDAPLPERVAAQKLILEHEMGEFFKAIALGRGVDAPLLGFRSTAGSALGVPVLLVAEFANALLVGRQAALCLVDALALFGLGFGFLALLVPLRGVGHALHIPLRLLFDASAGYIYRQNMSNSWGAFCGGA